MIDAALIVPYARSWIGTKWVHQGRRDDAIDCAGLLVRTAQHFDLPYEDLTGYGRNPESKFQEQIDRFTLQGSAKNPPHGAIGIFDDKIMPCHTGIISNENGVLSVIHAEALPARCVVEEEIEDIGRDIWNRLVDVRLFKNVNYV